MKENDARWVRRGLRRVAGRNYLGEGSECVCSVQYGRYIQQKKYEKVRGSTRKYKGTAEQVGFWSQKQYESLIGLRVGK